MLDSLAASMRATLETSVWPGLAERVVLVLNHLLRAQSAASGRLVAHAGKTVRIDWHTPTGRWPRPPAVRLLITPAGLFETAADAENDPAPADTPIHGLRIEVDLPEPLALARLLVRAERPAIRIEGDTELAADIAWLADHLRWDAEHDLARVFGDLPARGLVVSGQAVLAGLRGFATQARRGSRDADVKAAAPR